MKALSYLRFGAVLALGACAFSSAAVTTIDAGSRFSYGANIGWINWAGDVTNGAVIGEYVCSGYLYSANVGWINLGSGIATNGVYYQNVSSNDFGVNLDAAGNLRGFAYGANIGWINFETNGLAKVDLNSGRLSGYAYSANCGWISLSNASAFVQTDTIARGADANGDGIPDAWEIQNFGTTAIDVNADPDHDGASNLQEYLAGTDPNNGSDVLKITYVARNDVTPNFTTLHWTVKPSRAYVIQSKPTLLPDSVWMDSIGYGAGLAIGSATFSTGTTNAQEFYRIKAYQPLLP